MDKTRRKAHHVCWDHHQDCPWESISKCWQGTGEGKIRGTGHRQWSMQDSTAHACRPPAHPELGAGVDHGCSPAAEQTRQGQQEEQQLRPQPSFYNNRNEDRPSGTDPMKTSGDTDYWRFTATNFPRWVFFCLIASQHEWNMHGQEATLRSTTFKEKTHKWSNLSSPLQLLLLLCSITDCWFNSSGWPV